MALANFTLVLFLLISALVFIVLVMLMRQIKKDNSLPPEKMGTLAAVLFIPALLIFGLFAKSISNWRTDIQLEQERAQVTQFVRGVYEPLATSQSNLLRSFSEMRTLLNQIEAMKFKYPNHSSLITLITKEWDDGQGSLYSIYNTTDKEIRRAWISYNTMDQQDVLAKFAKKSVQLNDDIKRAHKKYRRHIHSVQDELIKDLDRARWLLDEHRKPTRSKKRQASNDLLSKKITPFNDSTTSELINYSSRIDDRLKNELLKLKRLIQIAGQQSVIIQNHLNKNKDLKQPLSVIINNWEKLEAKSTNSLNQILYAIESEMIVLTLGLSPKSPAINAIHKSLLRNIPYIVSKAIKQRKVIDQSYNLNP